MNKIRLRASLHVPTLLILVLAYVLAVVAMWTLPHRGNDFGRMHAHQLFASLGNAATFGAVDRTLVDWNIYNSAYYDRIVWRSTLVLTGPFLLWCCLVAFIVGTWQSTRAARSPDCCSSEPVEPGAALNGGSATPSRSSGVMKGPPSVS